MWCQVVPESNVHLSQNLFSTILELIITSLTRIYLCFNVLATEPREVDAIGFFLHSSYGNNISSDALSCHNVSICGSSFLETLIYHDY